MYQLKFNDEDPIKVDFKIGKDENDERSVLMIKLSESDEWYQFERCAQNYKLHKLIKHKIETLPEFRDTVTFSWILNQITKKVYLNKSNKFCFNKSNLKLAKLDSSTGKFDAKVQDPKIFIENFLKINKSSNSKFADLLKLLDNQDRKKCLVMSEECESFTEFIDKFLKHYNEIYQKSIRELNNLVYVRGKSGSLLEFCKNQFKLFKQSYQGVPEAVQIQLVCNKLPREYCNRLLKFGELNIEAFLIKVEILEDLLKESEQLNDQDNTNRDNHDKGPNGGSSGGENDNNNSNNQNNQMNNQQNNQNRGNNQQNQTGGNNQQNRTGGGNNQQNGQVQNKIITRSANKNSVPKRTENIRKIVVTQNKKGSITPVKYTEEDLERRKKVRADLEIILRERLGLMNKTRSNSKDTNTIQKDPPFNIEKVQINNTDAPLDEYLNSSLDSSLNSSFVSFEHSYSRKSIRLTNQDSNVDLNNNIF